jgi:hypothetical protein
VVVVHEIVTHALQGLGDDVSGLSETVEDSMDVITLFHRDNARVIFLINPNKEVSGFIVEDTSGVGPVATASGG